VTFYELREGEPMFDDTPVYDGPIPDEL
jgi:hypothetical protein